MEETSKIEVLAGAILSAVKVESLNFKDAIEKAQELRGEGRVLLTQLLRTWSIDMDISRVVELLGRALVEHGVGRELKLIKLLVDTFYLFVELYWYLCVLPENVEKATARIDAAIVQNSIETVMRKLFPTLPSKKAIDSRLKLRCAEQIGNILVKNNSYCEIWVKCLAELYVSPGKQDCWSELLQVPKTIEYDIPGWYYDVHNLHMLSISVLNLEDFDKCMDKKRIDSYCQEGGKRTQALAVEFMSIITDNDKEDQLRERAFHGSGAVVGLKGLLNMDPKGMLRKFNKVLRKLNRNEEGGSLDRYYKTRRLVLDFLSDIKKETEGPAAKFGFESWRTISNRFDQMKDRLGKSDKAHLEEKMDVLKTSIEKGVQRNEDELAVKRFLAGSRGSTEYDSMDEVDEDEIEREYQDMWHTLEMHGELEELREVLKPTN